MNQNDVMHPNTTAECLSHETFQSLIAHISEGFICLDMQKRITLFNEVADQIVENCACGKLYAGAHISDFLFFEKEAEFLNKIRETHSGAIQESFELQTPVGKTWVNRKITSIFKDSGEQTAYLILLRDITAQKQHEHHLLRMNSELQLMIKVNNLIIHNLSIEKLLEEVCKVLVNEGHYKLAWCYINLDGVDENSEIEPTVSYGCEEYLRGLKISLSDMVLSRGPTATCLRFGKMVLTNNCCESDDFSPWSEQAKQCGINSSLVLPIQVNLKVIGCMNIYSTEKDAFDELELSVLNRIAGKLSIAIQQKKQELENEEMRYQLNERVKELSTIYKVHSLLQNENLNFKDIQKQLVDLLPLGWQYTDRCSAKIVFDGSEVLSQHYTASENKQVASFDTINGKHGYIEVNYRSGDKAEKPLVFMEEERLLINNLSEMLQQYYNKKHIFNELRKSEAHLSSVFDNTEVGHLLLDKDLKVLSYNKRFEEGYLAISGLSIKTNDYLYNILLFERHSVVEELMKKVKKSKKSVMYDTCYARNGKKYFLTVNISPIVDNNEIEGYCMSALDITDRKMNEIEKLEIINNLMQRNRDLEQFAYIVSHNLRSPVAKIIALSEYLKMDIDESELHYSLDAIEKSAHSLDLVIRDLNEIIQVKKNDAFEMVRVDLKQLFEEMHEFMSEMITSGKVTINSNFDKISVMYTVRSYIHSIFYNLISNSIKYARPDVPPRIDIWTERKGEHFVLNFKDNGIGIDLPKYREQIFGLYKRFNSTVEGKGFGLFMVKSQVEALNGKIDVMSTVNVGTHFILSFPMDEIILQE